MGLESPLNLSRHLHSTRAGLAFMIGCASAFLDVYVLFRNVNRYISSSYLSTWGRIGIDDVLEKKKSVKKFTSRRQLRDLWSQVLPVFVAFKVKRSALLLEVTRHSCSRSLLKFRGRKTSCPLLTTTTLPPLPTEHLILYSRSLMLFADKSHTHLASTTLSPSSVSNCCLNPSISLVRPLF